MHKPRVLLDVDGVLADFLTPSFAILNAITGLKHKPEDLREWDLFSLYPRTAESAFYDECNAPGLCAGLPIIPGAQAFVASLLQFADVYVVTSPMNHNRTWAWEREQWLQKHFDIPAKKVVHTSAKYLCLGDVLIDDKPSNIEAWERAHGPKGIGLLWDAPYNQGVEVGRRMLTPKHAIAFLKNLRT